MWLKLSLTVVLLSSITLVNGQESSSDSEGRDLLKKEKGTQEEPETLPTAQALTDDDAGEGDLAGSSSEIIESLPTPQAMTARRTMPDMRERLIGMTFLGQPVPLDYRPRKRPFVLDGGIRDNRRMINVDGPRRRMIRRRQNELAAMDASTAREILKPMPVSGSNANIILPEMPKDRSKFRNGPDTLEIKVPVIKYETEGPSGRRFQNLIESNRISLLDRKRYRNRQRRPPFRNPGDVMNRPVPPYIVQNSQIIQETSKIRRPSFEVPPQFPQFSAISENFGNSFGPDFGPVMIDQNTHENEIGGTSSFVTFENSHLPTPNGPFPPHMNGFLDNKQTLPPLPQAFPPPFRPSKPFESSPSNNYGGAPESQNAVVTHALPDGNEAQCNRYSETVCLTAQNYPDMEILAAIDGDKNRINPLIADVRHQSADDLVDGVSALQEEAYDFKHYFGNNRRSDSESRDFASEGGYVCPSEVKYARPVRAQNSKGEWKFIVNVDKYTQTLRMEKCLQPGGSCSYVSSHYESTCNQVHNYQRLLAFERRRGLHMDIFKVPSSCSCHIQGYSFDFPPFGPEKKSKSKEKLEKSKPKVLRKREQEKNQPSSRRPTPFNRTRRPAKSESSEGNQSKRSRNESSPQERKPNYPQRDVENNHPDQHQHLDETKREDMDFRRRSFRGQPVRRTNQATDRVDDERTRTELLMERVEGDRRFPSDRGPGRMGHDREYGSRGRSDNEASNSPINYSYHPISRFFDGYQK